MTGARRDGGSDDGTQILSWRHLVTGAAVIAVAVVLVGATLGTIGVLGVAAADETHVSDRLGLETALGGGVDLATIEELILENVNDERAQHGLAPLESEEGLAVVGRAHSEHMFEAGFYGHVTPDGTTHQDRVESAGFECRASENIAAAFHHRLMWVDETPHFLRSPEGIAEFLVESWMGSPPHRTNILSEEFARHGVGVVADGDGKLYATHMFCS